MGQSPSNVRDNNCRNCGRRSRMLQFTSQRFSRTSRSTIWLKRSTTLLQAAAPSSTSGAGLVPPKSDSPLLDAACRSVRAAEPDTLGAVDAFGGGACCPPPGRLPGVPAGSRSSGPAPPRTAVAVRPAERGRAAAGSSWTKEAPNFPERCFLGNSASPAGLTAAPSVERPRPLPGLQGWRLPSPPGDGARRLGAGETASLRGADTVAAGRGEVA